MLTLKQFRKKYKITQKDLARLVGTTPSTLSKYENGIWHISQHVIDVIKREYGEDIRPVGYRGSGVKRVWTKKPAKTRKQPEEDSFGNAFHGGNEDTMNP